MLVCELFKSIQGESSFAGQICSFVRLTGCNLKCTWCDTGYARTEGVERSLEEILTVVAGHEIKLVEITGGEPLIHEETPQLCKLFIDKGYTVLVETNGSRPIDLLPPECVRIVDIKCPGSGENGSFLSANIASLTACDELKFVIDSHEDFLWAVDFVKSHSLSTICPVHFSPVLSHLDPADLAQWIIAGNVPVRLSLQLHKILWGNRRGV